MSPRRPDVVGVLSERPSLDYLGVAVPVLLHLFVVHYWKVGDGLDGTDLSQRLALYAAGGGAALGVGGVTSVAVGLYQALGGIRGDSVRQHAGEAVRRNWRALLVATGISPALALLAMALDRTVGDPLLPRFIFEGALLLTAARFTRLVWLFGSFMRIDDASRTDKPKPPPPAYNPKFGPRPSSPTARPGAAGRQRVRAS